MKTTEYLKSIPGGADAALAELEAQYDISAKIDGHLVLLDYGIRSPKTDPITIECRSLILSYPELTLVSKKFSRFFNYGEAPDLYKNLDLNRAVVMEKADGSLIGLYYGDGKWRLSTRGLPNASGNHLFGGTFFDKALAAFGFETTEQLQSFCDSYLEQGMTYVFEYISPENRIVTPYTITEMVLLGVNDGHIDLHPPELEKIVGLFKECGLAVRMPTIHNLSDMTPDNLLKASNNLDGLSEGFVVWDPVSNLRVKMKSNLYVKVHGMRGENTQPTPKNIIAMIHGDDIDEFLAYFPEYTDMANIWKQKMESIVGALEALYGDTRNIVDQKEFALAVTRPAIAGHHLLFMARKTKKEVRVVFDEMKTTQVIDLVIGS